MASQPYLPWIDILTWISMCGSRSRTQRCFSSQGRATVFSPIPRMEHRDDGDTRQTSEMVLPEEVVVSKRPMELVQTWLGMTGEEAETVLETSVDAGLECSRPPRLGLGAKFLSHKKAAAVLSPVQRRLEKNIRLAKEKGQEEAEEAKQQQEESSDDEEEKASGKYALKGKRKKRTPAELKAALHGQHNQKKKRKGLHGVS